MNLERGDARALASRRNGTKRAPRSLRLQIGLATIALAAIEGAGRAQTAPCSPPCAEGQTCIQSVCMVPAPPPATYAAPPPGWQTPLPAYPAGRPAGPPRPPRRRYFNLMPYLGLHSYQGDGGTILGPGYHAGGLIGLLPAETVAINLELTIDILRATNLPRGDSYSEADATVTLSPLVFFPLDGVDLALGPKLGVWLGSYDQNSQLRGQGSGTYTGFDLGANAGAFWRVSRKLWLGGLASFDLRTYARSCVTPFGAYTTTCTSDGPPSADKVLALSLLLRFST